MLPFMQFITCKHKYCVKGQYFKFFSFGQRQAIERWCVAFTELLIIFHTIEVPVFLCVIKGYFNVMSSQFCKLQENLLRKIFYKQLLIEIFDFLKELKSKYVLNSFNLCGQRWSEISKKNIK